jgi:hypothetical protein
MRSPEGQDSGQCGITGRDAGIEGLSEVSVPCVRS